MQNQKPTIGILFPGEMGCSLGALLSEGGFSVCTTAEGRSSRTSTLALRSGLLVLNSVEAVLERSDILISLVTPDAALPLAKRVASLHMPSSKRRVYVDANSISPMTATRIGELIGTAGLDFLDAAIFGLASRLRERGVIYLSGNNAQIIAEYLVPLMRVNVVGEAAGKASALKMIVSAVPKSIAALFLETMLLARQMDLLPDATDSWNEFYPGVMEVVNRLLPTYPQHAERRRQELHEVEQTMLANNLEPRMLQAAQDVTATLAAHVFDSERDAARWSIEEILEELHKSNAFAPTTSPATRA